MSRQKRNQSTHDNRVRREVNQLIRQGWEVQADLPNLDPPDPIGKDGRIPDIYATRGNRIKIVEVETPSTVGSHKDQQSTFRRSAAQRENAEFELIVTKPRNPLADTSREV